ncbi:hypothetical protein [Oenococcus sicerae]|uniref:hypothetical protein n=1 Tax=Oenococcus sicerae TaxID=2203724 RepID=UPI0010AFA5B1|nr:hypothetical protein OAL24_01213 [Oenococcus sicerae]
MIFSKWLSAFFVIFYAVLVWAVFSMHNMLAMQMMAIGMFAEALLSFFKPNKK